VGDSEYLKRADFDQHYLCNISSSLETIGKKTAKSFVPIFA
jgi:hypothetical protein